MVIIAIMLDPPSIHVPNFEFAVGCDFNTNIIWFQKTHQTCSWPVFSGSMKTPLIMKRYFPAFCSIIPGLQKNTSCFYATLSIHTTHQPINLSCGISPKLMHVQLEMTSLRRRVQIADSFCVEVTEVLANELSFCRLTLAPKMVFGATCLPRVHFGLPRRNKKTMHPRSRSKILPQALEAKTSPP